MEQESGERYWLDQPLDWLVNWNWEKGTYLVLAVLAFFSRLYMLGVRSMSHDESLHVVYSYNLYAGKGYQHSPMMHGPLLFHLNALAYFLFGDTDFTSRLVPALLGIALVLLPIAFRRWIGRLGAISVAFLLLISPSVVYYSRYIRHDIYAIVAFIALLWYAFRYLEEQKPKYLVGVAVSLAFSLITKEVAFIYGAILGSYLVILAVRDVIRGGDVLQELSDSPPFQLAVMLFALVLPLTTPFIVQGVLHANPVDYSQAGIIRSATIFVPLLVVSLAVGYVLLKERFWLPALLYYTILVLFFTTFFTNYQGIGTGFVGSLGYWLVQQGVRRGSQPWYYYLLLVPLYEFLPLTLGLGGIVAWVSGRPLREEREPHLTWADYSYRRNFITFLVYWVFLTFIIYTWAGEKMPWLIIHFAVPLSLLGGWFVGRMLMRLDWKKVKKEGGLWWLLVVPLFLYFIDRLWTVRPFAGRHVAQLQATIQWVVVLGLFVVAAWYLLLKGQAMGGRLATRLSFLAIIAFLSVYTMHVSWRAAFINYDNVKESIVYAHATPDIKRVMGEITAISQRLYGDNSIKVPYDDDSTWPLEWYLRHFPNKLYYGAQPNKDTFKDAPVAIVGSKNLGKAEPYLKRDYYRFKYRLIWWPLEGYKGLTWSSLWADLHDPAWRGRFWDAVLHRKYQHKLSDWPLRHDFYLFIRKDIARQMWDMGTATLGSQEVKLPEQSAYDKVTRTLQARHQIGIGQLNHPRDVAAAPDGTIYVADSSNNRIVHFDAQGKLLNTWGQKGTGSGEFNEPWGIVVDKKGNVYVADTWNHRVQKFDANGKFLKMWGYAAMTGGKLVNPGAFFGPRALAFAKDGNLLVVDTGNKRVETFTPGGDFLAQYGGVGAGPGQFDEPVGIAVDQEGNIYVADTWNHRVEVFTKDFTYRREWSVEGWDSQSVVNKPYLAVAKNGDVYVTDPENYRVLVFSANGKIKAVFGNYGTDAASFKLPNGIAVDGKGQIWVADADNSRVLAFPLLP